MVLNPFWRCLAARALVNGTGCAVTALRASIAIAVAVRHLAGWADAAMGLGIVAAFRATGEEMLFHGVPAF